MAARARTPCVDTAVTIIGGGPVGLCLAVELGWRGIDCIVLERRERGAATFPTANHIGVRTMEHLRRLGLAAAVRAAFRPDWGGHWIALTHFGGHEVTRVENALGGAGGGAESPEREAWAPKPCFDPILERAAEAYPSVTLSHGARVEAVENIDGPREGRVEPQHPQESKASKSFECRLESHLPRACT